MRLPSWHEINEKISNFENKAMEEIGKIQDGHPLVAAVIEGIIESVLPPPFASIATNIFTGADGSDEDKTDAVLGYLKNLQMQGENHYNQIATKLDSVLININDLKQITAKESTLQTIQDILINSSKNVDEKLSLLRNDLKQIDAKIDRIEGITNKDLSIDQDTNQRIRELESELADLLRIAKERFTQNNITTTIKPEKRIQISQSFVVELEKRNKEIEYLRTELSNLNHKPKFDIEYASKTANAYYFDKKYDKAMEIYDQILKVEPKNDVILSNKGITLANLGRNDEAIEYCNRSLEIDPKNALALANKGAALVNLGRNDEAIKYFDRSLEIDPKNLNILTCKGVALSNLSRNEEALEYFDRFLEIDPKNAIVLTNKGTSLANLGRNDEAIKYYNRSLEIDPKNALTLTSKNIVLDNMRKSEKRGSLPKGY